MKLEGFEYIPKIRLTLTKSEIDSLALNADRHYDYKCREANKRGGVVYELRGRLSAEDPGGAKAVEVTLEFHDVDIMAKIVERDDAALYIALSKTLRAARAEYERLNKAAEATQPL